MYFWKTNELAEAIKNGNVSERDWKSYYLASNIFLLVSIYLSALSPRSGGTILYLVEAALIVAITIFGINFTFKTNEALNGNNYIARVTALGFPILIKIFIFGILIGFIDAGLAEAKIIEDASEPITLTIFTVLAQAFFFWRVNFHLKIINT
jgi:hypothetical protein